jgi:DNA-binding CsgD family transcriptional regulator
MLLDRSDERVVLESVLDSARQGMSRVLVLEGEAGMGKTALLDHFRARAHPLRTVSISGIEAESTFGFAALHRLLLPFFDQVNDLPPPQRDGLSSAFGLSTQAPGDLFLVGLATLTLLAEAALSDGLLCVVDDAQWVDHESLRVLAFVGRRLRADGIALVFGLRASDESSLVLVGLPSLEIGGLPEDAALEILSRVLPGPLEAEMAARIVADTGGCPLALTELTHELTSSQLERASLLPEPIPISRRLETHFRKQVDTMSTHAQMFLLIAATETSGDPEIVRWVAAQLGCTSDAEAEAIHQRLVATDPRIEFRHPLIRSAVYAGAKAEDRRNVHQALASLIDRTVEPDRWAGHIIASATGPDDVLAADLEVTARRARSRGGYAAEAQLLAQAADLTGDVALRSARFLAASDAALTSGAPRRAKTLLTRARAGLTDHLLLAEAQQLAGRMRVLSRPVKAPAELLDAARQFLPLDMDRARQSLLEALDAFLITQYFTVDTTGREIAETALATRDRRPDPQLTDLLLDGTSLLLSVGYEAGVDLLSSAARRLRDGPIKTEDTIRWFNFVLLIANELWDDKTFAGWAQHIEGVAREQGALMALQVALLGLMTHEIRAGHLSVAETHFAEALEITGAVGGVVEFFRPLNVTLLAWRGENENTRTAAQILIDSGSVAGSVPAVCLAQVALAILELSLGRYSTALTAAQEVTNKEVVGWMFQALPIVVEAGVRSGNKAAAESALDELTRRAQASGTPWALGLLARSRALLADDNEAGSLFEESITLLQETLVVTDLAQTHLVYGEWLRRQNRQIDARVQLHAASELFMSMGAAGFMERTRIELAAAGGRMRRRSSVGTGTDLTAQELQIARMASCGSTNPEIAAKLFVSSSTVDYHLKKVFRKLGITSRRQLEQHLPQ